jgi:hypothetical protein
VCHSRRVIKNAILHLVGEQPMLADLVARPQPTDVGLLCTNLRTIDGKRPRSVEHPDALFVIPMATLRLLEIPGIQVEAAGERDRSAANSNGSASNDDGAPAGRHELAMALIELPAPIEPPGPVEPAASARDPSAGEADLDTELESSEELLRRIRDL